MADRSRRDKKAKLDKLAEYRHARDGGGRSWEVGVPMSNCSNLALNQSLVS
jgi:hypothetical protein